MGAPPTRGSAPNSTEFLQGRVKDIKSFGLMLDLALVTSGFQRLVSNMRRDASKRASTSIICWKQRLMKSFAWNPARTSGHIKFACLSLRRHVFYGFPIGQGIILIPPFFRKRFRENRMSDFTLISLSMIGRALPMPTSSPDEAIDTFVKIVTSEPPVINSVDRAECVAALVKSLAKRGVTDLGSFDSTKDINIPIFSPGGTSDSPRSKGGYNAAFQSFYSGKLAIGPRAEYMSANARSDLMNQIGLLSDPKIVSEDTAKVLAVPEIGFKWRIVTKNPFSLVFHSSRERARLFGILRLYRSTSWPLYREDAPLVFPFRKNAKFLSGDLKSATDYISYDFIDDICRLAYIHPRLVKSFIFSYKLNGELHTSTPNKGTFMGLPLSWLILSLIHLSVCLRVDSSGRSFYLKGDDIIAYWTTGQIRKYYTFLMTTGMVVNQSKTLISDKYGWFVEKFYKATHRENHVHLIDQRSISLRFVTVKTHRTERGDTPQFVKYGSVLQKLRPYIGKEKYKSIFQILKRELPNNAFGSPDIRLPMEFGGLGFRPYEDSSKLSDVGVGIYNAIHNGILNPISIASCYKITNSADRSAIGEVRIIYDKLKVVPYRSTDKFVVDDTEFLRHLMYESSFRSTIWGESLIPEKGKKASRILRDISRVFREVRQKAVYHKREVIPTFGDAYRIISEMGPIKDEDYLDVFAFGGSSRFRDSPRLVSSRKDKYSNILCP